MKYIKSYESINKGHPKVGDYILADALYGDVGVIQYFFQNSIGEIVENVETNTLSYVKYFVKTEREKNALLSRGYNFNYTKNENGYYIMITKYQWDEIKYWATTKEELELKKDMNKYNL